MQTPRLTQSQKEFLPPSVKKEEQAFKLPEKLEHREVKQMKTALTVYVDVSTKERIDNYCSKKQIKLSRFVEPLILKELEAQND